jgi:hypothetical protein
MKVMLRGFCGARRAGTRAAIGSRVGRAYWFLTAELSNLAHLPTPIYFSLSSCPVPL